MFSPEFLREGRALNDNLYPSRIVVGYQGKNLKTTAEKFAMLLKENAILDDAPILLTGLTEAESIKLFANTYLALRVAFFNELDSFAQIKKLDSKQIIDGVCLDPRVGSYYNNPSFGYGGYCLPKDTKQLLSNFDGVPNDVIMASVAANATRKNHIAREIMVTKFKTVGIYRLVMKNGSDNFRQSSVLDIIEVLKNSDKHIIIFEPLISDTIFNGCEVINDLDTFKKLSELVLANRYHDDLCDIRCKVYTRDIYYSD